jgi:hypothetical protein
VTKEAVVVIMLIITIQSIAKKKLSNLAGATGVFAVSRLRNVSMMIVMKTMILMPFLIVL